MRFCNRCGRLYDENKGKCQCQKNVKREYKHNNFYDRPAWRKLSSYIRVRDFNMDRLALYLAKTGEKDDKTYKLLRDYLIDAYGNVRRLGGAIVVHHIVPREEAYDKQYDIDNLISLNTHTHEYVHQLYCTNHRDDVQRILRDAVQAVLP